MNSFLQDFGARCTALLAQTTPEQFQPATDGSPGGDFRASVWIAYGLALLLLAGFSIFLVFQNRGIARRLVQLSERFEHSRSKGERQASDA